MIVVRFLLNEKGRTNPDSIRFMRTANALPEVDNTVTPLGYPFSIKILTYTGLDEFWASKLLGIAAFLFMVSFAYKKQFFFKEILLTCGLFSFVSIFSYTMSEALILPPMLVFLYVGRKIILGEIVGGKALFMLSAMLILLYNIRYPALFIIGGVFLYGLLRWKKDYGKTFVLAAVIGFIFVGLYKIFFIDYFNENYVKTFLNIGLHPTSKLLVELIQGLCTVFNPFIHIANPGGGLVNIAIYGIGAANILLILFVFWNQKLSETEFFYIFISVVGIVCSYFIQYFYSVNPIDYRLMAPFSLAIWMVYFRKIYRIFGVFTYGITALSLACGLVFTWLSRGNYLENRREITRFLKEENLERANLKFFLESEKELDKYQVAELISTVNPRVKITFKPQDTLQKNTLTQYKVLQKIKIDTNRYQ